MRKLKFIFAAGLLAAFASVANAQTTTVIGTFHDPNGLTYAGGTLNAQLITTAAGQPTINRQSISGLVGPVSLNPLGAMPPTAFWSTSSILPAGATWKVTVCSVANLPSPGLGPQCGTIIITTTGGTKDISVAMNAVLPAISQVNAGATIGGSIASTQVAFGSGVNTIAGSPNFTYLSALGALILKNDGTNGVPQITLFDTSAVLGDANQNALYFAANNSAATQVAYAVIYATQINRTAGTETGELSFIVRNAGNPVEALSIQALGIGDMLVLPGKTSGQASFAAAPIAGTPNPFFLPTTTGLPGQFLRTDGANPQQTSWGSGISPNGYVSCTDVTPCAAAATTILTSAAADSQYALNASVDCTSAVAAATAQLVVTYTDPSNTLQTITPSAAACTALGAGSVINITTTVRVKASTAIQYAVTPTNSPTYQASVAAILEGN